MHLLKKIIAGKKVSKKELKKEAKEEVKEVAEKPERESKEAREMIKAGKKTQPINARKSNHAKHTEVKKKRGTSNGYMPR